MTNEEMDEGWFDADAATFGDRVTGAREAAGMTQKQLAKRLGVKLTTVSGWENDLSEPRANKLSMLAGVLNVSLTWLLEGIGDGVDMSAAGSSDGDLREALGDLRRLKAKTSRLANQMGALEKRIAKIVEQADG
ncbi:helix-turn-helix domain-containing protein [Rhodalgimonas zhirmunskyi]|uniref:Helix-turn-helix domain-containing protein n=1 Tax=Rhodalgimonas zhirmunskyi TaxID=2964767 RepID=A0AAJ1U4C0_9RHOB|nr:helix-turn-helix transcriptional regulator [Rhodoalgimonas zhirmunskyi]MDQ2093430.1 helix-turn-helix domain-containing protein [Rhodoalgimonas zhirmunskyi]